LEENYLKSQKARETLLNAMISSAENFNKSKSDFDATVQTWKEKAHNLSREINTCQEYVQKLILNQTKIELELNATIRTVEMCSKSQSDLQTKVQTWQDKAHNLSKEIENFQNMMKCQSPSMIDIVFYVDTINSMGNVFENVETNFIRYIEETIGKTSSIKIEPMGYRYHPAEAELIDSVNKMTWRSNSLRYFFHINDAIPHSKKYLKSLKPGDKFGGMHYIWEIAADINSKKIRYKHINVGSNPHISTSIFKVHIRDYEEANLASPTMLETMIKQIIINDLSKWKNDCISLMKLLERVYILFPIIRFCLFSTIM